jgi:plasmid stability protein
MTDVLVRNVPEDILDRLKQRADEHHRSLQGELLTILEEAARARLSPDEHLRLADELRERLARSGRVFRDSVEDLREDRAR